MTEIFLKLFDMSITAGWLALAVILLRFILGKAPKWIFPALWGLVGIRLILPCTVGSKYSLIPDAELLNFTQLLHSAENTGIDLFAVFGIIWFFGLLAMLSYFVLSFLLLRRRLKTAVHLAANIYQCEYVRSPFILGVLSPRIYLPFDISDLERENAVAHECAHLKRRDHWVKPAAFILLSVYWFDPLMWLSYILLCRDIEFACDERVVKRMDSSQRADYSQALLSRAARIRSIAVYPLSFGGKSVKKRILAILNYKKPKAWLIAAAVAGLLILAVRFMTDPLPHTQSTPVPGSTVNYRRTPEGLIEFEGVENENEIIRMLLQESLSKSEDK